MRFIYVDETGRSAATDPAIIVLCIIVDADKQYAAAESLLAETLATVPARYRDGFIAHAWEILNSNRYKEGWPHQDRIRLLKSLIEIPGRLGIPMAVGLVRRPGHGNPKQQLSVMNNHHQVAFGLCLAAADEYICRHGGSDEVSTVVAENIPEMESRLLRVVRDLTSGIVKLSQEPGAREYRILRMTDTVHFVAKEDGPFLQIVDACAWVFQRFMSGRRFGPELFEAMTGLPVGTITPEYYGLWGQALFYPPPPTQR